MEWINSNLQRVRECIATAARRAGRDPGAVTLVAVTKGVTPELIRAAWAAGVRHFGENRIQEAQPKLAALTDLADATWHCVGHLQTNKAKPAVELFQTIHSVDSPRIADALEARAAQLSRTLTVLLEVNVSGEASKHGAAPADVAALAQQVQRAPHLRWQGLMTVAPAAENPEAVRPVFRSLRALRDTLQQQLGVTDLRLSMGMSHDCAVAVEEGADLVRIGSAIFQERYWDGIS